MIRVVPIACLVLAGHLVPVLGVEERKEGESSETIAVEEPASIPPERIEAFRRVLRGAVETGEQREVVELTQLALGRLYYETDQLDQAIEAYQASMANSQNNDNRHVTLSNIAELHMAQGDLDRAISTWRESLRSNDSYVHAILGLAMALERQGRS